MRLDIKGKGIAENVQVWADVDKCLCLWIYHIGPLTLTMLWTDLADNKLVIFFLFFLENRIWHFMQTVS